MAQVAERQSAFASAFEAFRREAAFGSSGAAARREAAFERFLDRGVPTTRDEEWKFTNVAPLAAVPFARAPRGAVSRETLAEFGFDGATEVVVVNGRLVAPPSSDALPTGLTVRSLAGGAEPDGHRAPNGHAFVDLNTAFADESIVIAVAPHAVLPAPIHVLCVSAQVDVPVMASPRLVIEVGEHAQASVVESYVGVGAGAAFTNGVTEIRVGPSALLHHVKLQRERPEAFHLASTFVHVARAGTFASTSITLGGRIARNDIVATLEGEGAECTLNGLYVAAGETLVDTHTTIDHAKAHCPSHEVYKGILSGRARAVFNGKIIVRPDAQKTDAKQTNKALLLTDDAQINTKPQLEIFADDVKCTHGAAIGQLDEDAMFYLRARGIAETDARNLLIHAFAGEVLDGISVDAVRERAIVELERLLAVPHVS